MGQHYTRNTVSVAAFCKKCNRSTSHRVDGVKMGPCLECIAKLEKERVERGKSQPLAKQENLFG